MTSENISTRVDKGMQVRSADGKKLGKVRRVCMTDEETYIEIPLNPGKAFLMAGGEEDTALYIPSSAVAAIRKKWLGSEVVLQLDAAHAQTMTHRPKGIEPSKHYDSRTPSSGGL